MHDFYIFSVIALFKNAFICVVCDYRGLYGRSTSNVSMGTFTLLFEPGSLLDLELTLGFAG